MRGHPLEPGDVLDERYRLIRHLGRGGFGDVWSAEELLPGGAKLRDVALKLLRAPLDSGWAEEARIIASLRHPSLVTIYAAGALQHQQHRWPYVAMELLSGRTLEAVGEATVSPTWRRILSWARSAASALDSIHAADIVHLDLKPSNLFLRDDGSLVVLDFGIAQRGGHQTHNLPSTTDAELSTAAFLAKQDDEGASATTDNAQKLIFGTPGYMAPEIIADGEATPAADAFALACCIVYLSTGALPHAIDDTLTTAPAGTQPNRVQQLQTATLQGKMLDVDTMAMPAALKTLVKRWLHLDPAKRLDEGEQLRDALEEVWQRPHGRQPIGNDLDPHGSQHEGLLVGRQGDCDELGRSLARAPCLILEGRSGTGLTSLALAGVVPALAKQFALECNDWTPRSFDKDASLFEQLHAWLDERQIGPSDELPNRLLAHQELYASGLVVFVDNLQSATQTRLEEFVELVDLARNDDLALRALATANARPPQTHNNAPLSNAMGKLRQFHRHIGNIGAACAETLVSELVPSADRAHKSRLSRMVKTELDKPGLPLPFTILALRRAERLPQSERASCDLMSHFIEHCNAALSKINSDDQPSVLPLLTRMTRSDGTAIELNLQTASAQNKGTIGILSELAQARILYRRNDHFGLLHPDLGKSWPKLRDYRLHRLESLVAHEALAETASRWQLHNDSQLLYRGHQLQAIRHHYDSLHKNLTPVQEAFVAASLRAKQRQQLLRYGSLLLGVLCVALVLSHRNELEREAASQLARTRKAVQNASVERMIARSLRTDTGHERIALLGAAIARRKDHSTIALDLFEASRGLPSIHFLQRGSLDALQMAWKSDWLLGKNANKIVFFDLRKSPFLSHPMTFRPHREALRDVTPIAHAGGFVTRSIGGEVKVWKLNLDGAAALAALAPMPCKHGPLMTSKRSAVVACASDEKVFRWDLRDDAKFSSEKNAGHVVAVSGNGDWVATQSANSLRLWHKSGKGHWLHFERRIKVVSFSPRDEVVALASRSDFGTRLELYALTKDEAPELLHRIEDQGQEPGLVLWHSSGVDLALCSRAHRGRWHYLRKGRRALSDGPAPPHKDACRVLAHAREQLLSEQSYRPTQEQYHQLDRGHLQGAWRLKDGRIVARNLGVFDPTSRRLNGLLHYHVPSNPAQPDQGREAPLSSVAKVARHGNRAVWQVGGRMEIHNAARKTTGKRKGNLLRSCPDGSFLAWRTTKDGKHWQAFEVLSGKPKLHIERFAGRFIDVDALCQRIFFQHLDGTIFSTTIPKTLPATASRAKAVEHSPGTPPVDGYIFLASPSRATKEQSSGLWVALSSGRILRLDAGSNRATNFGLAHPFASAIADGPEGSIILADKHGLHLRFPGERNRLLMQHHSGRSQWSDLLLLKNNKLLLAARQGAVSLIDLQRGELLKDLALPQRDRLSPWDAEGNILSWTHSTNGHIEGEILPLGRRRALAIAEAASNLKAELSANGRIQMRLR